jgi:tetratricopeptide (TPR) repeat protein
MNHAFSFLLITFIFVSGCAHQSQMIELTAEQKEQVNREALALASERLDKMGEAALKNGPEAQQYLATNLFLKGNSALMEGDFVTGAMLFGHLVKLTDDPFVHKKYAVALIRIGEFEPAAKVLSQLDQKLKGLDESVTLILAGVYAGLEKTAEAQKTYRQILAKNPKQEDACIFLGKSLALEKKWNEARSHLQACQSRHPKNGIFTYYLGKMSVEQGRIPEALKFFEESHRREPSSTQTTAALGILYEQKEQFDKSIKIYKEHLALSPNDVSILSRMVQVLFMKEKFEEVIPYAEKLVDLDPEDLNIKVRLGILYTDSKEYDKAVSVFKEILQHAPQSDKILYYLGAIHQEQKKFETAIDYFTQIPATSGLYQDSSFQTATMLSHLAQVDFFQDEQNLKTGEKFVTFTQKKLSEFPDLKVELSVLLAGYFEAIEDDQKAIEVLKAVATEKNFVLQHQYYLAGLYEKVSDFEASTAMIMEMIEKDPKNAHAWNFIGYSMLERGVEPAEALPYIEKAVQLSPDDGYIRDSLGWYYFKIGRKKEALKELTLAFKKVPDDVVIAKHLAIIHKDMQNFSQARRFLNHAMKNARLMSEKREITSVMESIEKNRFPASAAQND